MIQTIEAIENVARLAASCYDSRRRATKRADAAISQIACLNHQEIHDREIANHLCDIRYSVVVRAENIRRRAAGLLEPFARLRCICGEPGYCEHMEAE